MVHGTVLLLLYLTGLRLGEALGLNREDVDLDTGVLCIRQAKFGKSRLAPMAPDLTARMRACQRFLDTRLGLPDPHACCFPGPRGTRCRAAAVRASFRRALARAEIPYRGPGQGPRLHDLRHSFAVHRLLLWYEQGVNLNAHLPFLATYLGHVSLAGTQRYLRLTEDLVGEVTRRHAARFGHLITERETP
jgi:integrase